MASDIQCITDKAELCLQQFPGNGLFFQERNYHSSRHWFWKLLQSERGRRSRRKYDKHTAQA